MTRILAMLAVAAAVFVPGAAHACDGQVNVCLDAQECSGGISVCPMAHPDDCHSNVDVCLDFVGPR